MALKDDIEALRATVQTRAAARNAIQQKRLAEGVDAVVVGVGPRRFMRPATAAEALLLDGHNKAIRDARAAQWPLARRAFRALLQGAAGERQFPLGPLTIRIAEWDHIGPGWSGEDEGPRGEAVIWINTSQTSYLMLRVEVKRGAEVMRRPRQIHLCDEPRLFVQTGEEDNPAHDPDIPSTGPAKLPVFGYNAREALRQLILTIPEVGEAIDA